MDRMNHVKIVSPDPAAVDGFLRDVLDVPEGWEIPAFQPGAEPAAPVASGATTPKRLDGGTGGFITGNRESGQYQILRGEKPRIWAIAIGTRHVERAHQRCRERGIPCSEIELFDWNERDGVRAFFAEVGGITFEVMRVEPKS